MYTLLTLLSAIYTGAAQRYVIICGSIVLGRSQVVVIRYNKP